MKQNFGIKFYSLKLLSVVTKLREISDTMPWFIHYLPKLTQYVAAVSKHPRLTLYGNPHLKQTSLYRLSVCVLYHIHTCKRSTDFITILKLYFRLYENKFFLNLNESVSIL